MRKFIKEILSFLVRYSGLHLVISNTYAKNKVAIILYHDITRDKLQQHLGYLSKYYNFITLDLLVQAIHEESWKDIPSKSLVITFDDGHRGNFQLLEVLKKYEVTPTSYLCSHLINSNRKFWWNVCKEEQIYLLKTYSNGERQLLLGQWYNYTPVKQYPDQERETLSLDELVAMQDYVDFQSHSCYHPILTSCSDEECQQEIFESGKEIERITGKAVKHFSFPNGNYSQREIDLIKEAGYRSARTTELGWNDLTTDPYKLKIVGIADNSSTNFLAMQLSGITHIIWRILNRFFGGLVSVLVLTAPYPDLQVPFLNTVFG
jgi:peptidoglycan/xylan/chitin deacetylase (PgdA/CDA1 family)